MIQKVNSKILDIKDLAKDTKQFILSVPKEFDFKAGQYVLLEMPIQKTTQRRAYSIASSPEKSGKIVLCIKKASPKGFVSGLFKLKKNSKINFIGPAGKFFIDKKPKKDLVFISVGTGIAPFKSMIEHLLKNMGFKKSIILIHGYRYEKDILYKKEFSKLENQFSNFKQKIILSKPEKTSRDTPKGHVHYFLGSKEILKNPKEYDYYICGMKDMIEEVTAKLKSLNVNEDLIFFEKYN